MNRLKDLKEQRAAKEGEMKTIMDLCANEKRNRKPEEVTKWEALRAEVSTLSAEISALKEQEQIDQRSAKPVVNNLTESRGEKRVGSIGDQIRSWQEANKDTINAVLRGEQRALPQMELRADDPMTIATVNAGSSVYLPNVGANLTLNDLVRNKPTFWNRLRKGRTNLNPYPWANKTNKQGAADFIGEGVLKPLASFDIVVESSTAKKVAERFRVSTELLHDWPGMKSLIENEAKFEVETHANTAVISATASSTDPAGIITLASGFTLTTVEAGAAPSYMDAVRAGIAQLTSLNFNNDIVAFINPIDGANIDLSKSGDDGHYLIPPFASANGTTVKGVQIIEDNSIPVGNLLIGDMSKYQIDMVEDLMVRWGYDSDDFSRNLITMICEMRFHQRFSSNHTAAFIYDSFADIIAAITTT
jgi:HK97 family phage major capsid protein